MWCHTCKRQVYHSLYLTRVSEDGRKTDEKQIKVVVNLPLKKMHYCKMEAQESYLNLAVY